MQNLCAQCAAGELGYRSAGLVAHVVDAGHVWDLPKPTRKTWPPADTALEDPEA